MALLWPKHGPHMVLQIGSYWILINVPRDVLCQISHYWVYSVASFPKNGQNMAKHGPHMVPQIGSSWIIIDMPRDAPCGILESQHLYWQIFSTFWLTHSVTQWLSQWHTQDVELCTWPEARGTAKNSRSWWQRMEEVWIHSAGCIL